MAKKAKQKLGPLQTKWLEMLESGRYRQASGVLVDSKGRYCCLGIACRAAGMRKGQAEFEIDHSYVLPLKVAEKLKFFDNAGQPLDIANYPKLPHLNDNGSEFAEIAAVVRKNPEQYFSAPA